MPKQTQIELNLLSSDDLMQELMSRYEQIIIIRENRKESEIINIKVKTQRGKFCKPEDEFDIILAQDLLLTAQDHLLKVYMGAEQEDKDGTNDQQDNDSGS